MDHFKAPYDKPSDIVLRSKDGVEYELHKSELGARSIVFKDMFELGEGAPENEEKPVVKVPELAATLDLLLPHVYASDEPGMLDTIPTAETVDLLEILLKYGINRGAAYVSRALQSRALDLDCAARILYLEDDEAPVDLLRHAASTISEHIQMARPYEFDWQLMGHILAMANSRGWPEIKAILNVELARRLSSGGAGLPMHLHLLVTDLVDVGKAIRKQAMDYAKSQAMDYAKSFFLSSHRSRVQFIAAATLQDACHAPEGHECNGVASLSVDQLHGSNTTTALAAVDALSSSAYCAHCLANGARDRIPMLRSAVQDFHAMRESWIYLESTLA